jgi:hypothetical protein
MQRHSLIAAATALLLFPVAAAAGPPGGPTLHEHFEFSDLDPDFCGTGQAVEIDGVGRATIWVRETGGDPEQEVKVTFQLKVTYSANDNSIVEHAAGQVTNVIVQGLESGPHTHVFVEKGLRARLKLPHGGVLVRDAGVIVYSITADEFDNVTDLQVLEVKGPHPVFDSDLFCETATEALGL